MRDVITPSSLRVNYVADAFVAVVFVLREVLRLGHCQKNVLYCALKRAARRSSTTTMVPKATPYLLVSKSPTLRAITVERWKVAVSLLDVAFPFFTVTFLAAVALVCFSSFLAAVALLAAFLVAIERPDAHLVSPPHLVRRHAILRDT